MIPENRMQDIIMSKDTDGALNCINQNSKNHSEFWHIIDGVLVVFDGQDPPSWLRPILDSVDEDGNTPGFKGTPIYGSIIGKQAA